MLDPREPTAGERHALLFDDGSLSVFAVGRPLHLIEQERVDCDRNAPPQEWTKIVLVTFQVTAVVQDAGADAMASGRGTTAVAAPDLDALRADNDRLRAKLAAAGLSA